MTGNKTPLVSILSSSFNHEKYVKFFIESVLAQTYTNWELIIVDDYSKDNTVAEIKKFTDPRIKLIQQPFNTGINYAGMTSFNASRGKYVVQCASDDMLTPNFVQTVVDYMEQHPNVGVFYPGLQCIDTENNIIPDKEIASYQGSKYELLNRLFYNENCLTSPGQVTRREAVAVIQPLDIAISQHQDYKVHIELLLNTDCFVSTDKLVLYRVPSAKSGISYRTEASQRRCALEEDLVMNAFLRIDNFDTLYAIFGKDLDQFGSDLSKNFQRVKPFVLGKLALKSGNEAKKIWGYKQIVRFINTIDNYKLVHDLYGFDFRAFLDLANEFDVNPFFIKYQKYKKLFNTTIAATVILLIAFVLYMVLK
ncbi:MAG: glycosyltransferase family 2 protein [Alphaproteobacteria bacterium]